ncbi:uncharacterized protein B0H18DRAFT_929096 [Fomitopsis serialis]|uniref:uncharacterized protein n=1 Tax=Fomitopsis serialis TaxID=139415 RepID=UPI0020078F2C|nr:uncharacterized protein B0H18DRAFT_929096 [Neoantrodia serialis]KAH9932296.1 hypothetical protein B0H18DRAFT_929096 [Neoantrodia serialis]
MRLSPAPAPSRGGGGILEHLRKAAPGQSVSELVDPPPPSFLRSPRLDLPYEPFEPAFLASLSKDLDKGFPQVPPPSRAVPHPFATHDVAEDDWQRFLHDVKVAGSLSPANRIAAAVAPISMHAGLTGMLVTKGIEHVMRNKKTGAVGELIDLWNVYFFYPRRMTVVLAKGSRKARKGKKKDDEKWRLIIAYQPDGGF